MTGVGLVLAVYKDKAKVQIEKSSACGHDCTSCGACKNPAYNIEVLNPVNAKVGNRVEIQSESSKILGVSFLLYILPVFVLIVSSLVCEANSLGWYSVLVFGGLLGLWYLLIKTLNKKVKLQNVITKIIS